MITIEYLEDNDIVQGSDWCRPLVLKRSDYGDLVSTRSTYAGLPQNNMKWVRVYEVYGPCWAGKRVKDFNAHPSIPKEFVRGDIPDSAQLLDFSGLWEMNGAW